MKKTFALALILGLFTLNSCMKIVYNAIGLEETSADYYMMSNGHKTFAYIPMHHVGTPDFYKSVAQLVDSFQNAGYQVYYEGVGRQDADSLTIIQYKKKLRKAVGINIEEYYDTTTKKLAGMVTYKGKHTLMNQPKYEDLHVNMEKALNVDLSIIQIIDKYEAHQKPIELSPCDLQTDLNQPYNCEELSIKEKRNFLTNYVIEMRDEHLYKNIVESDYDKILIIYGKKHYKGVKKKLIAADKSWKELK